MYGHIDTLANGVLDDKRPHPADGSCCRSVEPEQRTFNSQDLLCVFRKKFIFHHVERGMHCVVWEFILSSFKKTGHMPSHVSRHPLKSDSPSQWARDPPMRSRWLIVPIMNIEHVCAIPIWKNSGTLVTLRPSANPGLSAADLGWGFSFWQHQHNVDVLSLCSLCSILDNSERAFCVPIIYDICPPVFPD